MSQQSNMLSNYKLSIQNCSKDCDFQGYVHQNYKTEEQHLKKVLHYIR